MSEQRNGHNLVTEMLIQVFICLNYGTGSHMLYFFS